MTNIFDEAKKRPVVSGITLASIVGFLVLWPKVMPGLELIVRIQKSPDVADAALAQAKETREWIDAYIEQQKQQQALEQQRYELEQEFKKKLFEMQGQQQIPNQPLKRSPVPRQQPQVWTEQDEYGNVYCADGIEWWWPDEEGDCE